ncbi:MAG TPA: hypothetical protein VIL49_11740 [Capillimicrobium sp.]
MSPRTVARLIGAGRVAVGLGLIVAPRAVARPWIGDDADRPGTSVMIRGLGVRDLVLGLLAIHTVDHEQVAPRLQRVMVACDSVDLLATLAVRDSLPPGAAAGTAVVAGGAIAGGLYASAKL